MSILYTVIVASRMPSDHACEVSRGSLAGRTAHIYGWAILRGLALELELTQPALDMLSFSIYWVRARHADVVWYVGDNG